MHIFQVTTSKSAPNYGQNFRVFSQTHHIQHPEHSGKDQNQQSDTHRRVSIPARENSDNRVQKGKGKGNLWGNIPI